MPPKKTQNEPKKKKPTVDDKTVSNPETTSPTSQLSTRVYLLRFQGLICFDTSMFDLSLLLNMMLTKIELVRSQE
jgi:hypothetical protein